MDTKKSLCLIDYKDLYTKPILNIFLYTRQYITLYFKFLCFCIFGF